MAKRKAVKKTLKRTRGGLHQTLRDPVQIVNVPPEAGEVIIIINERQVKRPLRGNIPEA